MAGRKRKNLSFDTMVKMFLRDYGIPTKKDVEKLMARMDRLEQLIKTAGVAPVRSRESTSTNAVSASETVLEVIREFKNGAGFADIQEITGFDEKKLRNIIYRLSKTEKIRRISRGIYVVP